MKNVVKISIVVTLMLVAAWTAVSQEGVQKSTMKRVNDPIQVPCSLLTAFKGEDMNNLRLFAHRDGELKQVIYQFDERTDDGTWIMDLGEEKNPEAHNWKVDPQDYLVFRIMESGDRMPREMWPGKEGIEIELEDPVDGGKSYVYLVKFEKDPPKPIEKDTQALEFWDPWEKPSLPFIVKGYSYTIEGLVNKIGGKYYKTAINKSFRMPKEVGGQDINILDIQKMRAFCELFFGKIKIDADETNMIGGIDALRHGYVRGYGRQWMTVALPLGLEGPRIYSDVFTYDRIIVSPMQLNIPFNPESVITKAGIEFGYDLNKAAIGMRFYSPNCMDGVTIDGKMTDKEKAISDDWVPWFLITGPQGSLIFRVDIQKELVKQTVNKLTYIDDLSQEFPPEDVPGSIGYARTTMEITSVKSGKYNFSIEWYFPPNFYKPGGYDKQMLQDFLNIKDAPVKINVDGKSAANSALKPPMLKP